MEDTKINVARFPKTILRLAGFYIKDFTVVSVLKLTLVLSSFHIITLGLWGHLFNFLRYNKFVYESVADDVAGIISSYVAFYIQVSFAVMSRDFRSLFNDLEDFGDYDVPDGYSEKLNKLNTYFKRVIYAYHLAEVGIALFLITRVCEDGDSSDCGLVIIAYMPFDIFYTPARQIFMLLQLYSGFASGLMTICIIIILLFIMQCLVMQIRHLEKLLMDIAGFETRELRKLQIKKCVLYHYRIFGLIERAANISEKIFFLYVFVASIIISLTSYQLIALKMDIVTLIHLTAYFVCIFITCIVGEILIEESQNLCFFVYAAIPWDSDYQTARDLYIILMVTSREISLPAGKFGPVGHIRFMMMMKGSYSFLTLLLNSN